MNYSVFHKLFFPGMSLIFKLPLMIIFGGSLIWSCQACRSHDDHAQKKTNDTNQQEALIKNQQKIIQDESVAIDDYIRRHNYKMTKTETGLRYYVYKNGKGATNVKDDQVVTINYQVSLLDGTKIYSSDSTGVLKFKVGKSEVASGLQEGVKYLKEGDHAVFILPYHLAYGLTGDGDKIKQYEALVIDVKLNDIGE